MNKRVYSLYVMKKIRKGELDIRKGRTLSHEKVWEYLVEMFARAERGEKQ